MTLLLYKETSATVLDKPEFLHKICLFHQFAQVDGDLRWSTSGEEAAFSGLCVLADFSFLK